MENISNALSKEVYQYDIKGCFINSWKGTREIEQKLGFRSGSISECCIGKRKSAYGYRWSYIKSEKLKDEKHTKIKIYQFDLKMNLIKVWDSLMQIESNLKFDHTSISRCCNQKQKTAYGFIWIRK